MDNFSVPKRSVKQILVGLVVMISGYVLMLGGGSSNPSVFSDAMFSFQRIVLSPLLIVLGITIIIIAIMCKKDDDTPQKTTEKR